MRIPWELSLVLMILSIAAVAVQQTTPDRTTPSPPDLASSSAAPGGSRALYLWLQSLGYRVDRLEDGDFRLDQTTTVLLVLAPTAPWAKDQLATLRRWVERGGTLIIVGSSQLPLPPWPADRSAEGRNALAALLGEFGLSLRVLSLPKPDVTPTQPLLLRPPASAVRVEATSHIAGPAGLVPYLGEPERPIAAGLALGQGRVYALASTYAVSNRGLGEADNAAFLLNWLPAPVEAGAVVFDEFHHGRSEDRSLLYLMVHEPWGWAVLYALGLIFVYLLLDGRRFGRAAPSVVDRRRLAVEYVISLASLLRRGGKRQWVAQHYERTLRRQLATTVGLDPTLDTGDLAARLERVERLAAGFEGSQVARLLLQLRDAGEGISEERLVRLAADADQIIRACTGRRR
ncbi:MAG: DUF4350 domain-containing protein [Chloroflexi bacterium]|nr:DUF4350 domain-containing protein [Chloroflexota bacterium]